MRVYFSEGSDPMILDSLDGLNTLYDRLLSFLESDDDLLRIDAEMEGDAGAYDERLPALEVAKAQGPIMVTLSSARVLTIAGGVENLSVYAQGFQFRANEEGNHHHPELIKRDDFLMPGTMSIVVEADSELIEELRSNE